jgi:glycosyltransferase involved in cell wall biosynthesis
MLKASIIVPTRNRVNYLINALRSFVAQDYPSTNYEILVVDNGSDDSTKDITENMIASSGGSNIKYIFEQEPGLLSGRHRGSFEADGDILIFVDDDIEAVSGWLQAIVETFNDPDVHLVGGPSLPKFEVEPPAWLSKFWSQDNGQVICGSLSVFSLGDKQKEVDPCNVWGLNFAIRKKTLFDLGGFHPDCIPKELQHYQGDGETGLSIKLKQKGLKAIYSPKAIVYHLIPRERLTVKSFEERHFYQGVCDSFTKIRQHKGLHRYQIPRYSPNQTDSGNSSTYNLYQNIIYNRIHKAYVEGFMFHQEAVRNSRILLDWVLRDSFLDYHLPDLNGKSLRTPVGYKNQIRSFIKSCYSKNTDNQEFANLILIVGTAHRVGSTWLFQLLKDLCQFNSRQDCIPQKFVEQNTLILEEKEILGYLAKLKGNYIFKSHSYPVRFATPSNMKFVTVLRDPRDVIVSNCFYLSYLQKAKGGWGREFKQLSMDDRLLNVIKEGEFILSRLEQWYHSPAAHKIFYENLVLDPLNEIKGVLNFLKLKKSDDEIKSIIRQNSFNARTGRKPGEEIKNAHNRKGIIGDWKNYFSTKCIDAFKESCNGRWNTLLLEMGYENCEHWDQSETAICNQSNKHTDKNHLTTPKVTYSEPSPDYFNDKAYYDGLRNRLIKLGVTVEETELDINAFDDWLKMHPEIKNYYRLRKNVIIEKCLEHYLSYKYLSLTQEDIFIDIAASKSPWIETLSKKGIRSFRLDKAYSEGINGTNIGADASNTYLPDGMASALGLHCAFECFMGNVDIQFLKEAGRILNEIGRFVIVPLYLSNNFKNITSPLCDQSNVLIDEGAEKVLRQDGYKAPFSRNYSPEAFMQRVYSNVPKDMTAKVFYFTNISDFSKRYAGQRVYSHFMLYCEKTVSL